MRVFIGFALAGLVCAAICALQIRSFGEVIGWKSFSGGVLNCWGFSWLIQARNLRPWVSHKIWASRDIESSWNMLYHLGGNGPWIKKLEGTLHEDVEPPRGCEVEQVHMVSGV